MKPLVALFVAAVLPCWATAQVPVAPAPGAAESKSAPAPANAAGTKAPASPKVTLGAAAPSADKTTTAAEATTKATAAKGAADKKAKKEEPPAKIEGMEIARGAKGFLGLQIVGGTFRMAFYDAKKKPMTPDVVRATLRWTPNYKPGKEFYVLDSNDGKALVGPRIVPPPYRFKLFISLFVEGVNDPVESFVVDFLQ